jgi:selenocysteine-specific elongation factor
MTRHFMVTTAGHVDHGKSALVQALTGVHPDRLPEEKARGMTIDLGFGSLCVATAAPDPMTFDLGIIDVPGHEDFVGNMVAGVGAVDLALLVVAADDGWMPQTEEHLQILCYLGVPRAVVPLTKIDLAGDSVEKAIAAIREQLRGCPFENAPIVPVSVAEGRGLEELKTAMATVLVTAPPPRDVGKPRLAVDRAFTVRGVGTVVTGTLIGGCFRIAQAVLVRPGGKAARIRGIQSHGQALDCAVPGTRTALNLSDIALASKDRGPWLHKGIRRGDVVTVPELGELSDTCDVLLRRSARLLAGSSAAARPVRNGSRIRLHLGTAYVSARVFLADRAQLGPGEQCPAQFRFDSPGFGFAGDRFVIRDDAGQVTLAGGVILDPEASRKTFRRLAQQKYLREIADRFSPADAAPVLAARIERDGAVGRSSLVKKFPFSAAETAAALARLSKAGKIVLTEELAIESFHWHSLRARAAELIDAHHRTHPEEPGLPISQLRTALAAPLRAPHLFEVLLQSLHSPVRSGGAAEFVQAGSALRRTSHCPTLPPELQSAGARIRAALASKPFEPPSRKELAPNQAAQEALRFLLHTGQAVELNPEVVIAAEHYERAIQVVTDYLLQHGRGTLSQLRQVLGASRRIAIPLLEKFDRAGITAREGDERILKPLRASR